jgi:hypothetical protein
VKEWKAPCAVGEHASVQGTAFAEEFDFHFAFKAQTLGSHGSLSLRASATRLTGKHWVAPYASSLLMGSRAPARRGDGALAPAPAAHVPASHEWCRPIGTCHMCGFLALSPG